MVESAHGIVFALDLDVPQQHNPSVADLDGFAAEVEAVDRNP
jgi:hypothetical protein